MAGDLVVLSAQEWDRLAVIKQVLEGRLTRVKARARGGRGSAS